jgi:hypothetical protein
MIKRHKFLDKMFFPAMKRYNIPRYKSFTDEVIQLPSILENVLITVILKIVSIKATELWMSQPVVFLFFNYTITFHLYTNRIIPANQNVDVSAILINVSLLSLNYCTLFFPFQSFRNHLFKSCWSALRTQ